MRPRLLTTAALAVLAAIGLTACRTNVGIAASVGGRDISETQVNDYVTHAGVDPSLAAQAKAGGQELIPKVTALQILITEQVFEDTLRATKGGVPSEGALQASHDDTARLLGQSQQSATPTVGAAYDKSLRSQFAKVGLSASLLPSFLRSQELEYALIKRLDLADSSALVKATNAAARRVSVSPRYGKWDPAQLTVDDKAATPSYLRLRATPTPQASAASNP